MTLTSSDRFVLEQAVRQLEFPTLADKLTARFGQTIDRAASVIPHRLRQRVSQGVEMAIMRSFDWVLYTVDLSKLNKPSSDWTHKLIASGAGFAGGFTGPWGVLIELPVTTCMMMRTIADIARQEGENLNDIEARLACVQVLALDTTHPEGNVSGLGAYYALRRSLSFYVADAVTYLASAVGSRAASEVAATTAATSTSSSTLGSQMLLPLVQKVATRYGITVSEEVALQLIPIIGGIGGAAVNYLFMEHYQTIAHGHFTVRRMERAYGAEEVQSVYADILGLLKHD